MSTEIITLIGIGAAAGALSYYAFLRKSKANAERENESLLEIPIPALSKAFGGAEEKIVAPKTEKPKSGTPLKAICLECKEVATLPFRCKFCTELFCGSHRLPENHNCEAL